MKTALLFMTSLISLVALSNNQSTVNYDKTISRTYIKINDTVPTTGLYFDTIPIQFIRELQTNLQRNISLQKEQFNYLQTLLDENIKERTEDSIESISLKQQLIINLQYIQENQKDEYDSAVKIFAKAHGFSEDKIIITELSLKELIEFTGPIDQATANREIDYFNNPMNHDRVRDAINASGADVSAGLVKIVYDNQTLQALSNAYHNHIIDGFNIYFAKGPVTLASSANPHPVSEYKLIIVGTNGGYETDNNNVGFLLQDYGNPCKPTSHPPCQARKQIYP